MSNGPAELDGRVCIGDLVSMVDGEDVVGAPLSHIRSRVIGPAGTICEMVLDRPSTGEKIRISLVRQSQSKIQERGAALMHQIASLEKQLREEQEQRQLAENKYQEITSNLSEVRDSNRKTTESMRIEIDALKNQKVQVRFSYHRLEQEREKHACFQFEKNLSLLRSESAHVTNQLKMRIRELEDMNELEVRDKVSLSSRSFLDSLCPKPQKQRTLAEQVRNRYFFVFKNIKNERLWFLKN